MEHLGIINYPAFVIAGILLNITPGVDTVYILARTISLGRKAGVLSVFGISTGGVVHTVAAACGLSLILLSSAKAFLVVKYIGAMYLIYLGIKSFTQKDDDFPQDKDIVKSSSEKHVYVSGVLTNVLNPKVALFFLAFLPQFTMPESTHTVLPFLILGATFITTGTLWGVVLVLFAAQISARMSATSNIAGTLQKVAGAVFIALGIRLALSEK